MPTSSRIIWNDPGTRWTNTTDRTKYQFIASLVNTCGLCLSYHMCIGYVWSIPLHFGCRCRQVSIKPGSEAPHAFVDFRELLDNMPHDQQVAAIGSSNYKLLKNGVVEWKDIVTPSRVRPLREVVANKDLTIKTLEGVGIRPAIAKIAHASVNTPEHVLIAQHRRELIAGLHGANVSQKAVVDALAEGLASRVSIAAGPDSYGNGPAWAGGPVVPPGWSDRTAARLVAAVAGASAARVVIKPTKPATPKSAEESKTSIDETTGSARTFADAREADAWGKANYTKWANSLSQAQRNAIEDYRHDAWKDLNEGLRSEAGLAGLPPSLRRMAKNIDAALAKHPLPEPVTVVRSLDLHSAGITADQLKPGKEILDKGFTSTSLDPNKAWVGQRLEIKLPAGTPAAYVSIVGEGNRGEFELLVGRQVERYRVVEVKDDAYKTVVLEAILPPPESKAKQ